MAQKGQTQTMQKFAVPSARAEYIGLGVAFSRPAYSIDLSTTLTRTEMNYHDSKRGIPEGMRMSTAAEELAIQLIENRAGRDPRKAEVFNDLFGRNSDNWHAWQWTETALRVPEGAKASDSQTYGGNKYWARKVLEGDDVVGEMLVPEGGGRIATESDEVSGVPRETSSDPKAMKYGNHTTHFYFNPNLQEVAVARGSGGRVDEVDRCLGVYANYGRSLSDSVVGVRLVRGSMPKINRESLKAVPRDLEEDLLVRMRKDFRSIPLPDFQKKYEL